MSDGPKPREGDPSTEAARVVVLEADHCVATWRDFLIVLWRKDTTLQGVADLRNSLRKMSAGRKGIALLTIVEPNAPPPSSEVRDALAAVLAENGGSIKYSAVAFEGTGFRAAMVRGVVTGLTILARMPYPHKVFAGVDDAARWLIPNLERIGIRESVEALIAAVAELRLRIQAV